MTTVYRGQADIARWCGVAPAAVSNWMARFEPLPTSNGYPEPDAEIWNEGSRVPTRGWLPERRPEWVQFAAKRAKHPAQQGKKNRNAANMIYEGVQAGRIDPAEAVRLLHELI